jgi:hypothetical protein
MAAGDFSPSALLAIKLKAEQMWQDSQLAASYKANSETAKAILTNQTATFRELDNPEKDNQVVVNFINPCGIVAEDCESNCDISGDELETGSKTYDLTLCKKADFTVDAEKMRTNTYSVEEVSAQGLALAIKALDEYWSQQALVKLKAFAGINVAPAPYTYAAGTTTVAAADYTNKMIPNLLNQASLNRIGSPYFIDNGSLYVDYLNVKFNAGNLDGKGDAARVDAVNMYFDQWNFAPAGLTEDTFMIAKGAVAMKTKTRNPQAPTVIGGSVQQTRYTVASPTLPGVRYDVYYSLKCITRNGKEALVHAWRIETRGGIFLNPEGCPVVVGGTTYTPTGVISYTKGA